MSTAPNTAAADPTAAAAAGAADRALRKVFDTEARTALEQALAHGETGERPAEWDAGPDEPLTWRVRIRHEIRAATQAALEAALAEPDRGSGETETAEEPQEPRYPTLEAFVIEFLGPIIARRQVGQGRGLVWCPEWWRHAEAVARLMALWEAWEFARLDGGSAMSSWWTIHCDAQLVVLMNGEDGPFHLCRPERHGGTPPPLACNPVPPDWWG